MLRRQIASAALLAAAATFVVGAGACSNPSSGAEPAHGKQAGTTPGAGSSSGATPAPSAEEAARARAARGPEHAVFSLGDNRLLAHVQRKGGVVALAGSPGFAKYLRFGRPKLGFQLGQTVDGKKVALSDMYSAVELPLTAEQAKTAHSAFLRVSTPVARRMTVNVNDKAGGTVELVAGWQTVEVPLPTANLVAGENKLQLVFGGKGGSAAVEWIQLGGEAPGDATPPLWDAGQKALVLPQGGGLAYYVQVPEKGRVVADVVGAGCRVKVRVAAQDGAPVEGTLASPGASVELGALAGKIARLDLTAEGCPEARLTDAALAVPGAAPVVKKAPPPKHVILWIMDSLRADRVKPFAPGARPEVPTFDGLVSKATIFRNTYVQGNESRASHASIWSSLYVGMHRMIPGGVKALEAKWTTIDESMKAAGLFTSGVSSNGYITAKMGFGGSSTWDAYRNHIHDGGGVRGEDVLKFAIASVEKKVADPFFLYVGTIDTHVSWRAKEPWMAKYDTKPYSGRYVKEASGVDVEKMATGKLPITDRDKERIVAIYDSNVSYQDALLGQLFTKLAEWKILEDTMVIVTADHGDEQWEDGRVGHGASVRETLIRVPLVVYYPPMFPAGIIEEGADTIDILPTILEALGQPIPADAQGEALHALAQGVGRGYPRPSINSMYENWYAMRLAGWKVRVGGGGAPMLFHVAEDPLERKDLTLERPLERRMLTDAFSTFLVYQKRWKKTAWGVASNHSPRTAADLEASR